MWAKWTDSDKSPLFKFQIPESCKDFNRWRGFLLIFIHPRAHGSAPAMTKDESLRCLRLMDDVYARKGVNLPLPAWHRPLFISLFVCILFRKIFYSKRNKKRHFSEELHKLFSLLTMQEGVESFFFPLLLSAQKVPLPDTSTKWISVP
ncbi:hypothetical protein CEXT_108451 [Caerostris extrusa]|uniref:Uncharacterized protein n=1 Tax=Caerostris extrusa TaxID=172846 RepID=A0AAV4SVX0_CAEEX|nr:hypothetical protein CEXT_108451 [Caerostris extrusa]